MAAKGVHLPIPSMGVDTSAPSGKPMLTLLGGIARFEREIMLGRQGERIAKAKAAGKDRGRKPTGEEVKAAVIAEVNAGNPIARAARERKLSRTTVYKLFEGARGTFGSGSDLVCLAICFSSSGRLDTSGKKPAFPSSKAVFDFEAFTFDGHQLRTVMTGGKPWFNATDIQRCIGDADSNAARAVPRLCAAIEVCRATVRDLSPCQIGGLGLVPQSGITLVSGSDVATGRPVEARGPAGSTGQEANLRCGSEPISGEFGSQRLDNDRTLLLSAPPHRGFDCRRKRARPEPHRNVAEHMAGPNGSFWLLASR